MNSPRLRLVRPLPDPLGLYVRAGRIDHKDLQSFVTSEALGFTGVVFEAKRMAHQGELRTLVLERGLDAVLDPQTQAMGTVGGYVRAMDTLPWSAKRPHGPEDFATEFQRRHMADAIAQFAVQHGFTQVLAPTHLIEDATDPWLRIDVAQTNALRGALDRSGGTAVQIQYSLALPYETFRTPARRGAILEILRRASIDGLWLNVDGCGSDSSPTAITRYCNAATDFQALGVPIVADRVGGLMGLSLLAFGGVGGLSHGITSGERFDAASWKRKPTGQAFGAKTRIYVPQIDLMLDRMDAERLFEAGGARARAAF